VSTKIPENRITPTELRLRQGDRRLLISFDDGTCFELSCEYLRINSPSAEVKGHGPGQEVLQTGKRDVNINAIEPVGNYAVKLVFDDGHDTGLYTWAYLHRLGREYEQRWSAYLEALETAGQSREPQS